MAAAALPCRECGGRVGAGARAAAGWWGSDGVRSKKGETKKFPQLDLCCKKS
uniref:Predicted protein n=1 Tax=Hordeum vulgare subsp. vulgare TaxID=112509 RepID=F2E5X8_HORVV|nr:predicted protein [Hordeum vulgare subsp. vulgare]